MMKFVNIFIINSIILFRIFLCYEVPDVIFTLLNKGFSLKIPDEPGIKQIFYIIKHNDECPTLLDILFEPQTEWTTIQTSKDLKPRDQLNISILVNHQGNAYKSHQYLVVGESNIAIKVAPPSWKSVGHCDDAMMEVKCKKDQTVVLGLNHLCQDQLLFEDDFSNTRLNSSKWSYDIRHRLIGTESEEFLLFDNHRENIFMHDGYLNIRPTVTQEQMRLAKLDFGSRCTPIFNRQKECELVPQTPFIFMPPFNSSQIRTSNIFQFKYGTVEIEAKLPKGEWILPYIMLHNWGPYEEKQIRIAFARGKEELLTGDNVDPSGKILYADIVTDVENNDFSFQQKSSHEHYGNDFHIYKLTWKSHEISMEIDGVKYGTISQNLNELNKFFFITFGVSVRSHIEFPDNLRQPNNKPWSNTSPRSI